MDLLVVPTIGFRLLYAFVIIRHDRRQIVSIAITSHPTSEWIARQITDAFPWPAAPRYLLRDRDGIYGHIVRQRLAAMGIRDRPIAARSDTLNGSSARSGVNASITS
jgi:hypothetical protein